MDSHDEASPVKDSVLPAKWAGHLMFTIEEAREILRVSRASAYAAAKNGELPTVRIGRLMRVTRTTIERLLG
jgi:excisionase family DNA binding protein